MIELQDYIVLTRADVEQLTKEVEAAKVEAWADGYEAGIDAGYDNGFADGEFGGYNDGYNEGVAAGYDDGYNEGFADGLAVAETEAAGEPSTPFFEGIAPSYDSQYIGSKDSIIK